MKRRAVLLALALLAGCDADGMEDGIPDASDGMRDASDAMPDASNAMPDASDGMPDAIPPWFTAVTFNTGSGPEANHDAPPDDGYGQAEADLSDMWYGNGLAWVPFVDDTRAYFAGLAPELVAFQEIFHPGDCPAVPPEARGGFVCEAWQPGDATVAQRVLGDDPGWQVACHPERPDKCLAVHARLGRFVGCDAALCLDGLEGRRVEGCGSGARVARGVVQLAEGGRLVVISVHGTSGFGAEEQACRVAQIEQIFVGQIVDGVEHAPLARADDPQTPILILGDLNTDPGRVAPVDLSAARWLDFVGVDRPFRWISPIGHDAPGGYGGVFDIDHQVGRGLVGDCRIAGLDGEPAVTGARFFDHRPVVCGLRRPPTD